MIQKHQVKISFSLALAAVISLGFIALASQPADAVPTCPTRWCSGPILFYGASCLYFEPITECYFRCSSGADHLGTCRIACSNDSL